MELKVGDIFFETIEKRIYVITEISEKGTNVRVRYTNGLELRFSFTALMYCIQNKEDIKVNSTVLNYLCGVENES